MKETNKLLLTETTETWEREICDAILLSTVESWLKTEKVFSKKSEVAASGGFICIDHLSYILFVQRLLAGNVCDEVDGDGGKIVGAYEILEGY